LARRRRDWLRAVRAVPSDAHLDGWEADSRHFADADPAAFDRWFRVARELRRRGYSPEDLAKILGDNFVRVFDRVLPEAPR
jgi:hypothetical protein